MIPKMFEWNSFLVGTNWIVGHGYGEKEKKKKRKKEKRKKKKMIVVIDNMQMTLKCLNRKSQAQLFHI